MFFIEMPSFIYVKAGCSSITVKSSLNFKTNDLDIKASEIYDLNSCNIDSCSLSN
jgi:hypothetical protein